MHRRPLCKLLLGSALVISPVLLAAQTQPTQPDNTKVNQRDRAKSEKTADQASNAQNDPGHNAENTQVGR
jgi:hypothetical protein